MRTTTRRSTDLAPRPPALLAGMLLLAGATLTAVALLAPATLAAQEPAQERPEADPADVESPEAIVAAAYDVISEPAGQERDLDRFRSLFLPEGRLIPSGRGPDGQASYQVLTVEEFIEGWIQPLGGSGFFERGVHAETERFGDIAHVFSTYESRYAADDPEPFQRGINSFQLWHDGDRWWIVTIFWHAEREGAPLPERYGG